MLDDRYCIHPTKGNVKPMTKHLLNARVQHSMKERGIDLFELLRQEPKDTNIELTPVEKVKLEKKRQKNRLHAKQSRERRNHHFAKIEKENKVLKRETKILRTLIVVYYKRLTRRDPAWCEIEVVCPPLSSSIQYLDTAFDCGPFNIKLPQDVTRKLRTAGRSAPYTFEELLTFVKSTDTTDTKGPIKEEDGSMLSSDQGISTQQNVQHISKFGTHLPTSSTRNELSIGRPVLQPSSDTYDKPLPFNCSSSVNMKSSSSAENQPTSFGQSKTSPRQTKSSNRWQDYVTNLNNVEQRDTNRSYFLNVENDAKGQSPWMVNSKLEETMFEFQLPIRSKGNENAPMGESHQHKHRPFEMYSQLPIMEDAVDDHQNNNPVNTTKRTMLVQKTEENVDIFTSEDTCPSLPSEINLTSQDSELVFQSPNCRIPQQIKRSSFQNMERSRWHSHPIIRKRLKGTSDPFIDDNADEMATDEAISDYLRFTQVSELEEVLKNNSLVMSNGESSEVFTVIASDKDNASIFDPQSPDTADRPQYDPASNFSSLNLSDMLYYDADTLEPTFHFDSFAV